MTKQSPKTTEQWIELIANTELPAITSTAKMLDKFSNDDKSSLPKLSKAILHDQALSSCLLKVANNAQHIGINKVTTVSRATVILGIQTVKNVCLTSRLVDSLLASKSLDYRVYEKLMQLMANSFFAAMLAKMMVPSYSDELQEEVYLAALLYNIGETSFWSSGGEVADELANSADIENPSFGAYCESEIGSSFNELSKGLVRNWNLSDLLLKALDQPESRTDEVKIIYFADKLSCSIAQPGENEEDFTQLLDDIADIMKISTKQLKVRIAHTREQAIELLSSYGAEVLSGLIKVLPKKSDFGASSHLGSIHQMSKDKIILSSFMSLTQLMKSSRDLNEYIQTVLIDSAKAFKFERCSFLMFSDDKNSVKSRFVFNEFGEKDLTKFTLNITNSENAIARVLASNTPILINDYTNRQFRDLITQELADFIQDGSLAMTPIKIGNKPIGVICGQYLNGKGKIETEDFKQLCSLVDHLNMCLTMIMLG
jgi:HD-like signal output (HDOD) protein